MKVVVLLLLVFHLYGVCPTDHQPPMVRVYSHRPGMMGKANVLICHVSNFHPPAIKIELLKNGVPMSSRQSDLAFEDDWNFHLITHANFTPAEGEKFTCRVEHDTKRIDHSWEPDE